VVTREASDIKVADMPVPSKEEDTLSYTIRRLTATESNIRETHKWHIRPAFSRRGTVESCNGD